METRRMVLIYSLALACGCGHHQSHELQIRAPGDTGRDAIDATGFMLEKEKSEICNAYDPFNDPYYKVRCRQAEAAVRGMTSLDQVNSFRFRQSQEELSHMRAASRACTFLNPYANPQGYREECDRLTQDAWSPPGLW
jgi:hypothetical protein